MDAAAFWQENKRWIVGVVLGAVVWLVAKSVIGSLWDPVGPRAAARRVSVSENSRQLYDAAARDAAVAEGRELQARLGELRGELAFEPDPRYLLAGKGMTADDYLTQAGRQLKQALMQAANRLDVQLQDKDLVWPVTGLADEIRGVLYGLNLIEEAANRLLDAHRAVRRDDPEAMGLRAIQSFRMEERRAGRSPLRPVRPGEVDLRDHLQQERITFQFQSDSQTALLWLESCRRPGKTLVVESLTMTQPTRIGEPVTVKGALLGVTFRSPEVQR